jgi:hypothetical protein
MRSILSVLVFGLAVVSILVLAGIRFDLDRAANAAECRPPRTLKCDPIKWTPRAQVRRALVADGMFWIWKTGIADAIITCESRWTPNEIGEDGELGLWQIHPKWHTAKFDGPWYSPYWNTEAAVDVYREAISMGWDGFSPWSCWHG